MRKLLAWLGMVAILAGCGKPDENSLKMITEATFPPYEFLRGREIVGIDVEICRAVAEKLGRGFHAETVDFDSVIPAVVSGKADLAAAGITVTEERKQNVDFSIPYVKTGIVVISKKSNPFKAIEQLKGKKIGVQAGTTSESFVLEDLKQEPERSRSPAEAVAGLKAGRCDFVIADVDPARNCVKGASDLEISDFITFEEYAIAIRKGQPELLAAVNQTIAELKASGRLAKWIEEYTTESDKLKEYAKVHSLTDDFRLCFVQNGRYDYLLSGLGITLEVSLSAIVLGLIIGFLLAIVRSTHDKYGRFAILNALAKVYLAVIRGTPMVVQLLITYYIILRSVDSKVLIAILAFGINSGAYQAEIIRAGIASVAHGQTEAGRALGLSYWRTLLRIVLPQAIRNVLPALGNEFIVLLKDTSIVGYVSLIDLAKGGDIIRSQTYSVYLPYLTVAAIYLALVMIFTALLGKLERALRQKGVTSVSRAG